MKAHIYNVEAVKALPFETFKKIHEGRTPYFEKFTQEDWINEYEAITGRKVKVKEVKVREVREETNKEGE